MKRILLNLILLAFYGIAQSQTSVLNPADVNVTFSSGATQTPAVNTGITGANPIIPPYGSYGIWKWVRTPKSSITWSTAKYKCYTVGNVPFRLRFPNSYVPGANDGKKYPIMVFYHGGGEANGSTSPDGRYDNEFQLYQGGRNFELKATNDEEAFIIFPQTQYQGWDDYYYSRMNAVIDEIVKNCKGDEDRVISMGLSIGGFGSVQYASIYPKRVAAVISSSPHQINNLAPPNVPVSTIQALANIPIWIGNGGKDTFPDSATVSIFTGAYTGSGGVIQRSYLPLQSHVMWDYQWSEEPNFDSVWSSANKSNPMVYNDNRFFCPGSPVSATMGVSAGFYQYEWDKDGATIAGASTNTYTATALGTYRCRFKRADTSTQWSAWSPVPAKIVAICPPVVGSGIGLKGDYYNGTTPGTTPNGTRTDASMNFYTENTTVPFSGIGLSFPYSTRWTGKIQAQFTETYTLYTKNDDGIRLWLNGVLLIDNWATHSGLTENTVNVSLIAGQQYDLKIEYYNINNSQNSAIYNSPLTYNTGIMSLKWSSPSTLKQMIPKTQLYNTGTGVPAGAPTCTSNLTPANAAVIATTTSTPLTWTAVANAAAYDVYVWTGPTPPGSPTATNLTTTSYTALGLLAGSVYNWYVVPKNGNGQTPNTLTPATGCIANKTTFTVSAPIPSCVTNTAPLNNSTLATQNSASLGWNSAATATSYDLYIWLASGSAPATATRSVTGITYDTTGLLPGTAYKFYVAPRNASGVATGCAAANTFTFTTAALPIPSCVTNTAPLNNSTLATQNSASLGWNSTATATSYDLYIWLASGSAPVTATRNVTGITYDTTGLIPGTTYKFYVAPRNASGAATGCAAANTFTFTTAAVVIPVPGCVTNTAPLNNSTLATQNSASLGWNSEATATSYDVYIWLASGSAPATATINVGGTTYDTTGLIPGTTYKFYVAPRNASGSAAGCAASNTFTFTTAAIPVPACVVNTAPLNNSTLATQNSASLGWNSAATATSYDVYVWLASGSAPATPTINVAGITYDTTGLIPGTAYKFYVAPRNASGAATGCAAANTFTFTTAAIPVPACVTNTAPLNNSTLASQNSASLGWNSAATATSYDVYIWLASGSAPATPTINVAGITYDTTGLIPGTAYKFYVAPRNASGAATGCAAANTFTFTTAAIPVPACVVNTAPLNNSTLASQNSASLGWNSAATATSYDVYIWLASGSAPATPTINVTGITYDTTGLIPGTAYKFYVAPRNASGAATGCAAANTFTFTTAAVVIPVPSCVANIAPLNNSTLATQNSASLGWNSAATATSYDVYIWLASGSGPATPTINVGGITYDTTGLLPGTTYKFYVAPRNASGAATGCAAANTFTFTTAAVVIPVPSCVINTAPLNNSTLASQNSASLGWNSAATATSYDVYIWLASGSAPATPTINVGGITYDTTGLLPGTTYKFYVAPRNASGAATGCAAANTFTFTTAAVVIPVPSCVTNTAPLNNSTLATQNSASLGWNSAATATSYDVYIWLASGSAPATPTINVGGITYDTTGLLPGTTYKFYIAPRNASGAATGCAAANTFTFTTAAASIPDCATNTSPLNNATIGSQNNGVLVWVTVPDATSYDVFVWTGASEPPTPTGTVTTNTYLATGLVANTLYNWYVVPKNGTGPAVGCGTTNRSMFTTAAIPVPECVINTAPLNNSTLATQNSASLGWNSAATATSYDVYIWLASGSAPATPTINVGGTTYDTTGLIPGTTYKFYVAPRNASGAATGCAAANTFTFTTAAVVIPVPSCVTNTAPLNNSTLATQNSASLGWNSAATATSYDVYIWLASGSAPATPTINVAGITYDTTGLIPGTTYKFYVAPRNASGSAAGCAVSNTFTFTTAAVIIPVPSCVTNTAPLNNSTLATQNSASLGWNSAATATSYDVYIWLASGSAPATATINVGGTTYDTTGLLPGTTYKFYVAPRNASGAATGCAAANTFTFTTAAIPVPACVTNTAPVNNSTLATQNSASLGWNSAATATSYDVYIWLASGSAPATATINVGGTTYDTTGLIPGTTYKFYVAPRNASGAATGCAAANTFTFTTAAIPVPACVTNTAPLNNSTLATQNSAGLGWNSAATATSYDVYIWLASGSAPATPTINVGGTTYDTTGLLPGTAYKFYVAPRNASGAATGCAAANTFTFTTAAIPVPACVTNTAPLNNSTLATQNSAGLGWNSAATATSYDVYIWLASGSAPATATINVGGTTYDTTGLLPGTTYKFYVAPRNASGAATGCAAANTFTFTTAAIPVPSCVINTSPAAGVTLATQNTATLSWPSSSTATSYDVYLSAGTGTPTTLVTNTALQTYNASSLAANTTYSWYIAPRNAGGVNTTCAPSNVTTFTTAAAPALPGCVINTLPAGGAVLPSQTSARLTWPASAGAASYDVYLAAGNAVPTLLRTNTTALTYYATGLTAGTLYSWYIAPRNANGANTACGATNKTTFTTAAATGGGNIAPVANGGTNITITLPVSTTTLDGTASYDPDGSIAEYYWYQTQGPVTATIGNFTGTPTVSGLTTAGTYIFGLQVKDNNGVPSYSQATVIVNPVGTPTVPACVTNTSPANGTTLATQNTATLSWPSSSTATSYDVYLSAGTGTPTTLVTNTSGLTYNATGLTTGSTYSWYVAPRNAVGVNTACAASNVTTFTTAAAITVPACVTNTSPAAGTTLATQTSVTLSWPSSSGASSYDVYLAAGTGTPTVLVNNTSALTYTSNSLNAGTTYSWYIAPRNAGGVNTGCAPSNVTTFTTAAPTVPLAACVTNTSPAAGSTLASQTSVTLTWPSSSTATSYDVYLAAGTGTPTVLVNNTSALTYTYSSLSPATTYSWYIAPRNASGANTACAPANVTTFTTATPPVPACVINTSPAAGATLATQNTATLSWPSSSTATSYDVYLSAGTGIPTTLVTNTALQTYNASSLAANTTYSWYIAPRNAGGVNTGCAPSNVTTFTTAAAPALPGCVINTLPASGAVLPSQTSARLTWPASAGAASYDVYLAAGNAVPTLLRTNTTALTYYATGLTAGTLYSWYIAPRNANGANTACGATNKTTFTTAAATGGGNIAPVANGGTNITITLPVSTTTLDGTASYDPDGSIAEYYWYQTQGPVTATIGNFTGTPTVSGLTTAGTYIFGLQVKDNNGVPSYSQATVIVNPVGTPTVPACVTNTSPANGTTLATQNTATLSWPSSSTATSYDVYLSAGTGTPTTLVTNTSGLTYNATGLTTGSTYSWYVAPRNAVGVNTACAASNVTTFTTAAAITVPACVTNTSPAAGTTLATQTSVTLSWPSSSGASSYDVYLAAGTGTPTVLVNNTSALTYTSNSLNAGTTYSWYIAPRNAGGVNTGCAPSNVTTFTTAAPTVPLAACVTNTSPAAGSTLASQTSVTLTWPSSSTATSYDVYLAAGTGTPTVLVNNTSALTYTYSSLSPATTYSWYIAPRNASGANTACAPANVTTFTTATPPVPACVINTSPAAGATLATQNTATLSWPSSSTATSYDVYLSAGTGIPTTLVTNTALQTYNASSLAANTTYSWYIAPRNAGGVNTGCAPSNVTTFTTAAAPALPGCVINTLPASGAVLPSQTSARLTWPASAGAASYDVYLAAGNAVPTLLRTNTTALTYYATGLTAGTLYSWYIAPRNANGANTACGATNKTTFTTAAATGGGNIAPVANGGTNITITLPVSTTTLDGTASYDPDGSIAEFYWYQIQGPVTTAITNFTGTPTVSGLTTAGTYIFGLQVKDNNGVPSYSSVTVTVSAAGALVADAGTNVRVSATPDAVSASVVSAVPLLSSTVSPNPVKPGQYARVQINSDKAATATISIVNSIGYIVTSQKVSLVAGMNTTNISTSSFGQGFYIVSIAGGSKPINMKLLVE